MTTLLICAGIILLGIFMAACSNSTQPTVSINERDDLKRIDSIAMKDESNNDLFNMLKSIVKSGETYEEYATQNGYENEIKFNEEIQQKIDLIENEYDKDIIEALHTELGTRGLFLTNGKGLIMHPREECYFRCTNTLVHAITKLMKNITYAGFKYNKGLFRSGSMLVTSKDIMGWKEYSRGTMYVTNQRVVLIGIDNKVKSIPLGQIVSYSNYENHGVLFQIANSNPLIFNLPCDGMFHFNTAVGTLYEDDLYPCLLALDKVFDERNNK